MNARAAVAVPWATASQLSRTISIAHIPTAQLRAGVSARESGSRWTGDGAQFNLSRLRQQQRAANTTAALRHPQAAARERRRWSRRWRPRSKRVCALTRLLNTRAAHKHRLRRVSEWRETGLRRERGASDVASDGMTNWPRPPKPFTSSAQTSIFLPSQTSKRAVSASSPSQRCTRRCTGHK